MKLQFVFLGHNSSPIFFSCSLLHAGPLWLLSYEQQSLAYSNKCYLLWTHVESLLVFSITNVPTFAEEELQNRAPWKAISEPMLAQSRMLQLGNLGYLS